MDHKPGDYLHQFHGGLLLRHHKRLSCRQPAATAPLPPTLTVALGQHIGTAAQAVVHVGQHVLRGELIGRPGDGISAAVHAPTSGTVREVARHRTPTHHDHGQLCVVIDSDGEDRWAPAQPLAQWQRQPAADIIDHLRLHGVVGLGGAVFPSHYKLGDAAPETSGQAARQLHTVIINGAECEPYLSCDEALILSDAAAVVAGARVLCRAAGAARVVIAVEDRMDEAAARLREQINADERHWISVVQVPTYYPEGGERQLIQVLTGREVPSGGLPQDLGLVCFNVGTAAAASAAVLHGRPLIERMVTVTGHCVREPGNWRARIGTPISVLLNAAGGFTTPPARLIMGGPLMGLALPDDQLPLLKATNCLLALTAGEVADPQGELPCINCGFCVKVCPAQLLPQELHWAIRHGSLDRAAEYGIMDCIECGCCDQVCPSHIPLVDDYRLGKHQLRVRALEQERAQRAKQRYAARAERLQRRAAEIAARRSAKKAALQRPSDAKARIAAALARRHQQQTGQPAGQPQADQRAAADKAGGNHDSGGNDSRGNDSRGNDSRGKNSDGNNSGSNGNPLR